MKMWKELKPDTYLAEGMKNIAFKTYNHLIFCTLRKIYQHPKR